MVLFIRGTDPSDLVTNLLSTSIELYSQFCYGNGFCSPLCVVSISDARYVYLNAKPLYINNVDKHLHSLNLPLQLLFMIFQST